MTARRLPLAVAAAAAELGPARRSCESCGRRPAAAWVQVPDAPSFAVCADCAPAALVEQPSPGRQHHGLDAEAAGGAAGVPAGPSLGPGGSAEDAGRDGPATVRLPVSAPDVVQTFGLLAAWLLFVGVTWWAAGHDAAAVPVMIGVGTPAVLVVGVVDTWLCRWRDRREAAGRARRLRRSRVPSGPAG